MHYELQYKKYLTILTPHTSRRKYKNQDISAITREVQVIHYLVVCNGEINAIFRHLREPEKPKKQSTI
jgi:hypothetical protein